MMSPTKHISANRARGFSLIELLVVLAVAAVLLGLVISPLASTFNFTNRARRSVEVQDAARYAMEVMSREIADAMGVVAATGDQEPFLYYPSGTPGQGDPVVVRGTGAISCYDENGIEHDLPNAMVDIVLPHDSLGLESSGSITQPLSMQHTTADDGTQHPIVVRYFVGLTHPDSVTQYPKWQNNVIMPRHRGQQNMYTLYRVEFDPYDKNIGNWAVATSETTPDGKAVWTLNPKFFYDTSADTNRSPSGLSARAYWRKKAVAIMPTDTMDLVDFTRDDTAKVDSVTGLHPVLEAHSLVTFNPMIVAADPASAQGDSREPSTYKTAYGHWTGLQNDGTVPAANFTPGISGMLPRIAVYKQEKDPDTGAISLHRLFDSSETTTTAEDHPSKKNRVLAWNSLKGTVEFSLPAPDYDSEKGQAVNTSIYDPLSSLATPPGAYITPGSEVVTVWEDDPNDPGNVSKYRPVVYSRSSSATKDIYEVPEEVAIVNGMPQQLPPPRTYIVTSAGRVIIGYPYPSVNNPLQPQPVPNGHRVTIAYYYQNNDPDDLVKVDYLTRELLTINLTARNYDPVTQKPITTTLSNRVRIRNTQR
ncbi:MAG TPA: prepilin-type N-terminal cleavage/methylation domain-containing protein [Armatimonadota bacterium]|jgi:prepilin-type N-terminal cleavage/methylation domain-containing protein